MVVTFLSDILVDKAKFQMAFWWNLKLDAL